MFTLSFNYPLQRPPFKLTLKVGPLDDQEEVTFTITLLPSSFKKEEKENQQLIRKNISEEKIAPLDLNLIGGPNLATPNNPILSI